MKVKGKCVTPDCKSEVVSPHIVCVDHWKKLPNKIKKDVQVRVYGWRNLNEAKGYLVRYYAGLKSGPNAIEA